MAEKTSWDGAPILEADINTYLSHTGNAWTTYTPAWTSTGTQPAVGNGSIEGAYFRSGRLITVRIRLTIGSTSTAGTGTYFLSAPFGTQSTFQSQLLKGLWFDASASTWYGYFAIIQQNTATIQFQRGNGTTEQWTATAPFAPATGDIMIVSGTYEAAS